MLDPNCNCNRCGKHFIWARALNDQSRECHRPQYCSVLCKKKTKPDLRICKFCRKEYVKQNGSTPSYCSQDCRSNGYAHKDLCICGDAKSISVNECKQCREKRKLLSLRHCISCNHPIHENNKTSLCRRCLAINRSRQNTIAKSLTFAVPDNSKGNADRCLIGTIGEKLFDAYCLRTRLLSCQSVIENNHGWDRLVEINGTWSRVQVKCLAKFYDGWQANVWTRLRHGTFDCLAIVNIENGNVWMFDSDAVQMMKCANDLKNFVVSSNSTSAVAGKIECTIGGMENCAAEKVVEPTQKRA